MVLPVTSDVPLSAPPHPIAPLKRLNRVRAFVLVLCVVSYVSLKNFEQTHVRISASGVECRRQPQSVLEEGLATLPEYCDWKARLRRQKGVPIGLRQALFQTRRVYIGASGRRFAGWESFNVDVLNVTNGRDFAKLFCVGEIQAFHSEHTFEHIDKLLMRGTFRSFYEYLAAGGYVRTSIPAYGSGHIAGDLDKQYGHVNFMTADELVKLMEQTGFVHVQKLEWTDFETRSVHTSSWDYCEGPVIRSVQYDRRNQDFLKSNFHRLNITYSVDGKFPSSSLAENTFSLSDIRARSTIVQGFKPSTGNQAREALLH